VFVYVDMVNIFHWPIQLKYNLLHICVISYFQHYIANLIQCDLIWLCFNARSAECREHYITLHYITVTLMHATHASILYYLCRISYVVDQYVNLFTIGVQLVQHFTFLVNCLLNHFICKLYAIQYFANKWWFILIDYVYMLFIRSRDSGYQN